MAIKVTCPGCQAQLQVPDTTAGKNCRCPKCQKTFAVKAPPPPEPEVPLDALIVDDDEVAVQKSPRPLPPPPKKTKPNNPLAPRNQGRKSSPPPKPKRSSGGGVLLTVLAVVGGLFVLGCGGIVAIGWYAIANLDTKPTKPYAVNNFPQPQPPPIVGPGPFDPGPQPPFGGDPQPPIGGPQPPFGGPQPPIGNVPPIEGGPRPPIGFEGGGAPGVPPNPFGKVGPDNPPPKVAANVVFPPPKHVFGLAAAPFTGNSRIVSLPSSFSDLCVGGGGRFVILHLSGERKVAVFDVTAATVVKYIPVTDDAKIAAGMDVLMIALPSSDQLQRWSLRTFEREAVFPLPAKQVSALCMGSASTGPLLMESGAGRPGEFPGGGQGGLTFVDPHNGKVIDYVFEAKAGAFPHMANFSGRNVRASADGRVFAARSEWRGAQAVVFTGGKGRVASNDQTETHMAWPSADGRLVFTATAVCSSDMDVLHKPANSGGFITSPFLPAVQGPFFMRNEDHQFRDIANGRGGRGDGMDLEIYLAGQNRSPITTWKDFDGVPGSKLYTVATGLTAEKRFLLIAQAKVLITVPETNDKLVLTRFDPDAILEKDGKDYLVVLSSPPPVVAKGAAFSYKPEIKSKKGGVKIKVETGPKGLTAANDQVTWTVPADFADQEVDVLLTVSDAARQEVFHSFRLGIVDQGALPQAVAPGPAAPEKASP